MRCKKCVKTEQALKEVLARLEKKAKELEEERAMVIGKPAMGLAVLGKQEIVSDIRRDILNILAGSIDF